MREGRTCAHTKMPMYTRICIYVPALQVAHYLLSTASMVAIVHERFKGKRVGVSANMSVVAREFGKVFDEWLYEPCFTIAACFQVAAGDGHFPF